MQLFIRQLCDIKLDFQLYGKHKLDERQKFLQAFFLCLIGLNGHGQWTKLH